MTRIAHNLRAYMRRHGLTEVAAARQLGIEQSTLNRLINPVSSKPIRNPRTATVAAIAAGMGVTVDALLNGTIERQDLAETTTQHQSHPPTHDIDRLAIALTAVDKALADVVIQGRLGTLAEAIQYAYIETFGMGDIHDRAQRQLFDRIVATQLRDWNGATEGRPIGEGPGADRPAAPARPAARGRRRERAD